MNYLDDIVGLTREDIITLEEGVLFVKVPTEELLKQRVNSYNYLI